MRSEDSISTTFYKLEDLETVNYDDLGVLLFWVLRKTRGGETPFLPNNDEGKLKEIQRFVHLEFLQQKSNWYRASWHRYDKFAAKQCELSDFCFDKECSEYQKA